MAKAREVFDAALHLMNETEADATYETRAVQVLNTLIAECATASAVWNWADVGQVKVLRSLDEEIEALDDRLCYGVLPYGLAGILYLDEDPARANSWWGIYQERLALCKRERPQQWKAIEDVYSYAPGGIEYGEFSRW